MDRISHTQSFSASTGTSGSNAPSSTGVFQGSRVHVQDIGSKIQDAQEELPQHHTEKKSAETKAKDRKKTSTADRQMELEKMLAQLNQTLGVDETHEQSDHVMALLRQFKRQRNSSSDEFLEQTKERFTKPNEQHAALLFIEKAFEQEFGKDASLTKNIQDAKTKLLDKREDAIEVCKGYSVITKAVEEVGKKLQDRSVLQIAQFYGNLISQGMVSQSHTHLMKLVGSPSKYLDAHTHFIKEVGKHLEETGPFITKEELGEMTDSIYNARFLTNILENSRILLESVKNSFQEGPM